ncbi:MAG: hypothetical protein Q9178_006151 [Gyalolechia marmorata]
MDIMEAWLSATIKNDLDQVLGVSGGQPLGSSNGAYEDDESNIRVKASKPGVVQIVKWEKYDETFRAWISDSTVRLIAIFASKAATQHENKIGKPITKETVGNIIQLDEAEIVATHIHGVPRTSKITLLIKRFKLIGSDTSAQIGNPRPFDATHEFDELLQKLSAFPGVRGITSRVQSVHPNPEKHSPAEPRQGNFIPADANRYGSQELFSQVPVRYESSDAATVTDQQRLGDSRLSRGMTSQTEKIMELMKAKKASKAVADPATDNLPFVSTPPISEQKGLVAHAQSRLEKAKSDAPIALAKPKARALKKAKPKRIRSRDLRIPKDQLDLLDSEDSWLPAKPGRRGPVAHIPPAILEEIVRSVEAKTAKQESSEQEGTTKSCSEDGAEPLKDEAREEAAETQPEVLISSQDWPSSSPIPTPRCELPRYELSQGSSPAAADNTVREKDRDAQHEIDFPIKAWSSQYDTEQAQIPRSTSIETRPEQVRDSDASEPVMVSTSAVGLDEHGPEITRATGADPSDSGSDLETSVLLKFEEQKMSVAEPRYTQEVPATAIQPQEAYLQVKRTPYAAWGQDEPADTDNRPYLAPDRFSSPLKRRRMNDSGEAYSVEVLEDQIHTSSLDSDRIPGLDRFSARSAQVQSSGVEQTELAPMTQQEAPLVHDQPKAAAASESDDNLVCNQQEIEPEARHPIFSPYVTKRRKVNKAPINFDFTQDEVPKEDPSITARRHREKYMARRKALHPEARTSPYNKPAPTISSEQPAKIIDKGEQSPKWFEAADNPSTTFHNHNASQADNRRSSQSYHQETTGSGGATSLNQLVKPSAAVSEPCLSPGLEPHGGLPPQRAIVANPEQPQPFCGSHDIHSNPSNASMKVGAISSTETSQQSNLSGQAQSVPELMTPAMSHSDLPDIPAAAQDTDLQPAIYAQFKDVYPEYRASKEEFLGICKKIYQLFQCDRMEHRSLWDDFIIRYQTDYPQYLERCVKNFRDPKTYERFYRDEIDEPKFNKRVIQPYNIGDALSLGHTSPAARDCNLVDDAATTRISPTTRRGARSLSGSSPVLGAVDETSNGVPPLFSGQPHTTEDEDRDRRSEHKVKNSVVKRCNDQQHAQQSGETIDATSGQISALVSTPPPVQTRPAPKDLVSKSPRRLPWLHANATAHTDHSLQNSAVPFSRRHSPGQPLPPRGPRTIQSASKPRETGAIQNALRTQYSEPRALKHPPPTLLPKSHRTDVRAARKALGTYAEDVKSPGSEKLNQPQEDADAVSERCRDHPTSLQGYIKFYRAIKPGRGNSWARKEDCKNQKGVVNGGKALEPRPIDVMSWRL